MDCGAATLCDDGCVADTFCESGVFSGLTGADLCSGAAGFC
ncbi:hypothetical protein J467_4337, partial [Acinetobacter baumannii 916567]